MDNKSSTTLLFLLASSSLALALFISAAIYLIKHPHLRFICLFSSSHPLLALNLLILLIIVSSRCFAISRNASSAHHPADRDELLALDDSPQRIIPLGPGSRGGAETDLIAETRKSRSTKKGTSESTLKKTKEGSHLRQLKHSHKTTEDSIRPPETVTDDSSKEVTSSGSSGSASLRREVSLTKEEVNRRVERFIRKFNDD